MVDRSAYPELTKRQEEILQSLLVQHIATARPVGSRQLTKRARFSFSSATVRNEMADLEEMGLLMSPHTSAGRVPSTLGYAYYVDGLMKTVELSIEQQRTISEVLADSQVALIDELLEKIGYALAKTSALISVVLSPSFSEGILQKIDLVRIASGRLLVVLTIRSGYVRSIMLEIDSSIPDKDIEGATQFLNERLSGLKLDEVRRTIGKRLSTSEQGKIPLIKLVIESAEKIFDTSLFDEIHVGGTRNVMNHPEFTDTETMRGVIEILEDRDIVFKLLEAGSHEPAEGVRIAIGEELGTGYLEGCSLIASSYRIGDTLGKFGVLGPIRMDYARLSSLMNFTATAINRMLVE